MSFGLSESELQTYENLYNNLGARITFKCDQVTYIGIIDAILPEIGQVKLRHTKIVEGDNYLGILRFRFKEVSSFGVVQSSESVNRYPKNEYLLNILRNSRSIDRTTASKVLYDDNLSDEDITDEEKEERKFVLDLPERLKNKLPFNYAIIDTIGEGFSEAILYIYSQQVIGVSFHGPLISRFGKLTWICISTNFDLFVFDIHKIGKEAIDKGLKKIFESKSIKKIIHDCRFASDCLAHQYNTLLSNVFDTRVADFVINRQQYNGKDEFHSWASLDTLLRWYLKVPQEFLFERETTKSKLNRETFLNKRSISKKYLHDLLKSVLYLIVLQEKLSKELLMPVYRATGFQKTILAHSSDTLIECLGSDLSRPDSIPPSLLMNGIQVVRFQKPRKMIFLKCKFIHPQTGKAIDFDVTSGFTTPMKKCLLEKRITSLSFDNKDILEETQNVMENVLNILEASNNQNANSNDEVVCDNFSTKLSFRQLDEVYHKLANGINRSNNIMDVKPSVIYASRFSDKQYFYNSNSNLDFSENVSVKNTGKESSESNSDSSTTYDECSDIWLKLRTEAIKEKAEFSHLYKEIEFLPG